MPRIRALIDSANRKVGDEWDVSDIQARLLCAPDLPGGQRAEYVDRAMKATEQPLPRMISRSEKPFEKRRYMRRDLRAQD